MWGYWQRLGRLGEQFRRLIAPSSLTVRVWFPQFSVYKDCRAAAAVHK